MSGTIAMPRESTPVDPFPARRFPGLLFRHDPDVHEPSIRCMAPARSVVKEPMPRRRYISGHHPNFARMATERQREPPEWYRREYFTLKTRRLLVVILNHQPPL